MPITYRVTSGFCAPSTISEFVAAAQRAAAAGQVYQGPNPLIHKGPGNLTAIGVGDHGEQVLSSTAGKTLATGLITCASVVYASTAPTANAVAHVHHANVGSVSARDVNIARSALGNPKWKTILVVFAHPNGSERGYEDSMTTIVNQGVPTDNVVEIANLQLNQFGINNLGQIGS